MPQNATTSEFKANPLFMGLEQLSIDKDYSPMSFDKQDEKSYFQLEHTYPPSKKLLKNHRSPRHSHSLVTTRCSSLEPSVASAKLPAVLSNVVQILRPVGMYATVILVNHVERTYKVRLQD